MAEDILPLTQGFGAPAPEQRLGDMATDMPVVSQARDYGMDYDNAPAREPTMGVWEAAFKRETTIGAIMSREDAGLTYNDDGTDPFEENKPFAQYASRPDLFVDVFNKQALARRRAQIDKETEMLAVQDRHPILYTGAAMAVQFADPVNWLPLMTVAKVGKGAYALGRAGMGVGTVGAFGAVGASAAAATAAQEAVLQSQQQLRTMEESATAIGGSFVLGGLLGVGGATLARAFSEPATRSALATVDAMIATNGSASAAAVASPAMVDIVTRLKGAQTVTTQEIEAATKTAMFEARQGRDLSDPDVLARVAFIDRLSTEIQRAAMVSQVSELEGVVRNSFGSDGARLLDEGGVKIVQSVEDLPARADGVAHFDDTKGVFDGQRAYIVADNVAGADVRGVVLHEVGVHYGMQRMLGDANFRVLLDDVTNRAAAGEARFAEALAAVPKDTPAQHQAEEVLAYLVENAPELGIVQRVIAAVKQFIRQVSGGSYAGLSEADIRQLAVAALRKWNPEARPSEIRYARANRSPEVQRSLPDLVTAAREMASWNDWYERYQGDLARIFGSDAALIQKMLSATSQATSVPGNVTLALKAYRQYLAGEPFEGFLPAVRGNLESIRNNEALRGQKIAEYGKANEGDADGIAVDRHIAELLFDNKSPTAQQVAAAKGVIRQIAAELGWDAKGVQAALWAYNIVRKGGKPQSYDTFLRAKEAEIQALRARYGRGEGEGIPDGGPVGGASGGAGAAAEDAGRVAGISGQAADVRYSRGKKVVEDVVSEDRGKDATYAPLDRLVASDRIPTISISDPRLRGRDVFPTIADQTAAGALYKGIDGSELKMGIHLPGGPNYPFRETSMDAGVVWANKGEGVTSTKAKRAEQGQLMAVMLGDVNMHQSNSTVSKAFFQTIDAYVRDGRISPDNIAKIDDYVRETFAEFPGVGDSARFDGWVDKLSFEDRKRLINIMGGKEVQNLGGPSLERVLDATRDPEFAGGRWGDAVIIVELDQNQPLVKLGEQGTMPHPDYPMGVRGKVIGKLKTPLNYEVLYEKWLADAEATSRARYLAQYEEKVAKRAAEGKKPPPAPEAFVPNTRRAFQLGMPALKITDELVERMLPIEQTALQSTRQAQLAVAFGADKWRVSGKTITKGGVSPQEFVDAIKESPASATLTPYTADEVAKAVKAGKMRVFQLGEDGRVWFALKKGDPASGYDNVDAKAMGFGDNEVTLTSVVNNEQGVRGIPGEAIMLKAIQEGATALDAYAVQSAKFPNGFLPTYYRRFGFEEVGRSKFDLSYFKDNPNGLKDLEAFWSSTGWKKGDAYPDVVFMKWRGTDADRAAFTRSYLERGPEGILAGRDWSDVAAAAADAPVSVRRSAGRGPEPVPGSDRGGEGVAGRYALTATGKALESVKRLSDDGLRNFGLTRADIDALKYSRGSANRDAARTAPAPIADALNNGDASVVGRGGAIFYSRAGEKREKAGIIVYHGSPHDFDRFSMDKIGTGEGAQAYGHGLYFAESEGVARSYRDNLSGGITNTGFMLGGAPYRPTKAQEYAADLLRSNKGDYAATRAELAEYAPFDAEMAAHLKQLDQMEKAGIRAAAPGSMYEIRINADPDQFLDWDKPLSEQSEAVRQALQRAAQRAPVPTKTGPMLNRQAILAGDGAVSGDALYYNMGGMKSPADASAILNEAGIPGIKYLDAGSRAAGDGSRNYVVFDDALVEIVRKYSRGASRNERIAAQLEELAKALDNIDNPDAFVAAMSSRGGSVGAEAVAELSREDLQTYGKRANMVQDATWFLNPILRLRESPNPVAQKLGQLIFEDVIKSNMHMQGRTQGPQVETLIRQQLASILGRAAQQYEAIYQEGVKSGMRITRNQFSENISAAMRRGDESEIPAVVKAAKMWRDVVFDPLKRMAQETRIANTDKYLLDPDIETKFAESYLHRMANHQKLTADEFGFKKAVADWMEGSLRDEYTKASAATRARLAALDQDKVDLQLDPDARLFELEKLEKAYEDLDARFSREADIRRQDNELMAKAAELRRKGDRGGSKAALEAARAVRKSGGERYGEYLNAFKALNRRQRNVDFGFAGMAERQDEIVGKMGDIHDANLRGLERLVAKGQKLERDLARLEPQIRLEKIAELRDQIETVIEKTDKAAERLYNQVERAEKARARAALKVLNEKRAGGIREALAGNVESKETAAETARELALEESIRKYVKAEQGRSEKLSEIRRRIARVGIQQLDLDAQADELREAVNALIVQQSDMMIGRGDKVQRLKDKLARVDPAIVQKKLDQIEKDKQKITRQFYDRWEVQMGGEGVDINASVAMPRFSEWAKEYADQTFQHYSGRSKQAGTMPDFAIPLKDGPLQERTLPVPDTVLEPWLENDIGTIAAKYARSMLGQIEVTRKFGRPGMDDQFKQFEDGYLRIREQINAAPTVKDMMAVVQKEPSLRNAFEAWRRGDGEAKVTKERLFDWLQKREASDRTDLEAGLELMLGKFANEENLSDFGSISRLLVQFNMLTKMGGYVIGSLTDVYRPAMVHGFKNYMQHGIKPLLSNLLRVPPAVREELAQAGVGVEGWLRGYTTMNAGILDPYAPGSMVERMMEKLGRVGAKYSGMTWFNDFTRQVGGMESMSVILKAALERTNKDFLAVNGIDQGMAQRIADQFKVHGSTIKGVLVAGTDKWSDVEAARVLRAAISKDVSTIFTEKSVGDVPTFANRPLGRVIFQFRGFAFASNQRVLMRGLQDDHQQLVGALVGMTTIGMMVAYLRSLRGGEDRYEKFMKSAENPGFWIGEGLDNSGIFSLLFEAANTTEKLSQAAGTSINPIKNPLRAMFPNASQQGESTRFVRRDPLSSVLGPSASIPQDIGKAIAGAVEGDFRAAQKITPLLGTHPGISDMIKVLSGDSAFY